MQLPPDKKVILFGATYLEDRRKGIGHLVESFDRLAAMIDEHRTLKRDDLFLLAVGLSGKSLMTRLPFAGRYIGHVGDELMMALAYQSADVFVCPSVEDSGPMMIPEAMLCSTPVVAFNAGGAPDLVETMKTGYLARLADAEDLAHGICQLLPSQSLPAMRKAAREAAIKAHTPSTVACRHAELYQSLAA
jgi:glycosyltransferase involved in cell wall biosynthesis